MLVELVKCKIHRATVTEADVDYEGSIGIDADLMAAAGIVPYEAVHVWNVTRGSRLVTYAIKAPSGSGEIKTNGGAALHNLPGDIVIIAAFARMTPEAASAFINAGGPRIVLVNSKNEMQRSFLAELKE